MREISGGERPRVSQRALIWKKYTGQSIERWVVLVSRLRVDTGRRRQEAEAVAVRPLFHSCEHLQLSLTRTLPQVDMEMQQVSEQSVTMFYWEAGVIHPSKI
jgi:hypothetical protein